MGQLFHYFLTIYRKKKITDSLDSLIDNKTVLSYSPKLDYCEYTHLSLGSIEHFVWFPNNLCLHEFRYFTVEVISRRVWAGVT